jgi:hypothetical protein
LDNQGDAVFLGNVAECFCAVADDEAVFECAQDRHLNTQEEHDGTLVHNTQVLA